MTTTLRSLNVTSITMTFVVVIGLVFTGKPVLGMPGDTVMTPAVIAELPIEVETEVGPAGSLKLVPLWKETVELLENPHA